MGSLVLLRSLILFGAASLATQSPRGLLVVVNSGDDSVALVDLRHPNAPTKIATHKHPQDVVISPDRSLAYVAEMGTPMEPGNTVAVIDLRARTIIKRMTLSPATLPHLLSLSRDGNILWAACAPQNTIVEIDTRTGTISKLWDTQQKGSYLLAVTPDEKRIYVANFDAGTVSVIRRSDASVQILSLGGQPIGIDIAPNGHEVWVSNFQNNTITIIDADTNHIVQTLPAVGDGPARVKFSPDGKYMCVTNSRSNELIVFDVAQRRVVRRIATGTFSKGLLVLPDDHSAFVSAMEEDQVVEVDVSTGLILRRIFTGKAPEGLAWAGRQ